MEPKYPNLRRPRRKLCYVIEKESTSKKWGKMLTLEDVDRMFDDIDSSTPELQPSSPLRHSSDTEENQTETSISPVPQKKQPTGKLQKQQKIFQSPGPDGDVPHPPLQSLSPKPDGDLDIPFKAHGPVKTSSPIEPNMDAECVKEQDNEKDQIVSPILFNCEDVAAEEPEADPLPTEKPCSNGLVTEQNDGSELESPSRIAPIRISTLKKIAASACMPENTRSPVPASTQEPKLPASVKNSGVHTQPPAEMSSCVGKDKSSFLEKLKITKKSLVKVAPAPPAPPAPEPEDDFLILEDDEPLWFSIPSKSTTRTRQRLRHNSSTNKENSPDKRTNESPPDKRTNESPLESRQEQQEVEKSSRKRGALVVTQQVKKTKEKNHEVMKPGDEKDDDPSHRDRPVGGVMEEQKPKKNKRVKKVPSKESNTVEHQLKDVPEKKSKNGQEKLSKKTEPKKHKLCKENTLKENKKSTWSSEANTFKERRDPDTLMEVKQVTSVEDESQRQTSAEPTATEDPGSFTGKEIVKADGAFEEKHPSVSRESSPEDEVLVKRKRKQTGQWWLSSYENTEEPKNKKPTVKKPRRNSKDLSTAVLSLVKAKRDKAHKKRNQKQSVLLLNEHKNKEKKTKQTRKRRVAPDESKAADEIFNTNDPEQEQQQILDENLVEEDSSPLVFSRRDYSINSGGQIFQRVYHHSSSEKLSTTSAPPVSPRKPAEKLGEAQTGKRKRNPPGNWWEVNVSGDLGSIAPQPEQLHPRGPEPKQERKKQSKQRKTPGLGEPSYGIMAASSKPTGGAPPLKLPSAPKTIKQSLSTFKGIFTSAVETPTVVNNRTQTITSHPAGEGSSKTNNESQNDMLVGDVNESRIEQDSRKTLKDRYSQSEIMLNVLRSGPSSMIQLEQHNDDDDPFLRPCRDSDVLSVSDLCPPPLKPLTLHVEDETNLTEWFQSLWSTTSDDGVAVTPDQFRWYSYQDRALGFQADLNSGTICSGKLLLGSHMKKPLWVDHSATTVFHLLTSSVSVTIDGCVSRYTPGQAFMVECGQAYSIHNTNAQPAVLLFTRIFAESSD